MSFDKKTKSTSRTFAKGTDFHTIHDYFCNQVETEERDVPAEPSTLTPPSSELVTTHKYVVTVTRFIEEEEEQNG